MNHQYLTTNLDKRLQHLQWHVRHNYPNFVPLLLVLTCLRGFK
jgi:hypothetical protein